MGRLKQLIVLGSGPIGLLCALRGRQLGMDVDIYTNRLPLPQDPPRIECVPAQVVALLVEFGVSPTRIGVDALFHERIMQWSSRTVVLTQTPGVAHVGRPALDIALLETALRASNGVEALKVCSSMRVGDLRSPRCTGWVPSGHSSRAYFISRCDQAFMVPA